MSAALHLPAAHQLTHNCASTTATNTFDSWWQHYGGHFWASFVSATTAIGAWTYAECGRHSIIVLLSTSYIAARRT